MRFNQTLNTDPKKRVDLESSYPARSSTVPARGRLLVVDTWKKTISQSIQLIAGRTAQEFNTRKNRKGSFWEDRYHATAVDTDKHLVKCMVYIDLNMVRAGVVSHPSEYRSSGYNEIQNPPKRYGIINRGVLLDYFSMRDENRFREEYSNWITFELKNNALVRNQDWSESIAVGRKSFTTDIQQQFASRAQNRSIVSVNDTAILKEPENSYNTVLGCKKDILSQENTYFGRENV